MGERKRGKGKGKGALVFVVKRLTLRVCGFSFPPALSYLYQLKEFPTEFWPLSG